VKSILDSLSSSIIYFSFISELELLSFKKLTASETAVIKNFLDDIVIIDINRKIKDYTINLREAGPLKLPDSIIAATSKFLNIALLTADQAFKNIKDIQVVLYNP